MKIQVTKIIACSARSLAVITLQSVSDTNMKMQASQQVSERAVPLQWHEKIDNDKRRLYLSVHFVVVCIGHALHIIINCSSEIDNSYKDTENTAENTQ